MAAASIKVKDRFPSPYTGNGERVLFGEDVNRAQGAIYRSPLDNFVEIEMEGTDDRTGEDVLLYACLTNEQIRAVHALLTRAIERML
jgi:hypothetical protein